MSLDPSPAPITVRIRDACRMTGIGRSKLHLLIPEGARDRQNRKYDTRPRRLDRSAPSQPAA